jgi:outer membrane protein assembly factor BamD
MRLFYQIICLVFLVGILSSCSEYEKVLKSGDATLKKDKALEYYADNQYTRAVTLLEQIIPVYRGTKDAEQLNFSQAMCYYKLKDYILASHYFQSFVRDYVNSSYQEESEYLLAYCFYLLSPRPSLDQSYTKNAIEAFQIFIRKYPTSEKIKECQKLLSEMQEKLVDKAYEGAKLYYNLGQYKAAIVALRDALKDYPSSNYREEMMFLLLKSNYLLAENSVAEKQQDRYQNTIDEYYTFIYEYPQSKYIKEAEKIFDDSRSKLSDKPDVTKEITEKHGL